MVTQEVRPLIGPETVIVPLQNGVEASAQLVDKFGIEVLSVAKAKKINLKDDVVH